MSSLSSCASHPTLSTSNEKTTFSIAGLFLSVTSPAFLPTNVEIHEFSLSQPQQRSKDFSGRSSWSTHLQQCHHCRFRLMPLTYAFGLLGSVLQLDPSTISNAWLFWIRRSRKSRPSFSFAFPTSDVVGRFTRCHCSPNAHILSVFSYLCFRRSDPLRSARSLCPPARNLLPPVSAIF